MRITYKILREAVGVTARCTGLPLSVGTGYMRYFVDIREGHGWRRLSPSGTAREVWDWLDGFDQGWEFARRGDSGCSR